MRSKRLRTGGVLSAAVALSVGPWTSSAAGQTAYFSVQGSFAAIGDKHDFNINLSRSVSNGEPLKFQTFARNGGTNAAGDVIPANVLGIDSVLTLFDGLNAARGTDDDQPGTVDSLLTWTGSDFNLNPNPLSAGNYRLNMFEFNNDAVGPWVTDLVGPADAMTFTGATAIGTSSISSLKFGTTGAGANVATFNSASNFNVTGVLGVGTTGNGTLNVTAGAFTVAGVTTVNTNGRINVSGGTFTANNNVTLNGGKLIHTSGTFNLGNGRTLNANTSAQVRFSGSYSVTNGTAVQIQSGSSMSTTSYLDIGSVNNGAVSVDGAGSTLNVATGFTLSDALIGFAGASGSLTVSNGASATYGTPALLIGSHSTAANGAILVNSAATLSAKNMTIGNGTASIGTVTVNGSGSTITQSGSSTLTVGAAAGATGTGTINVQSNGVYTTGTGAITINKTGTVNVAGGTFNANGNITLDGGKLLNTSGTCNLAFGKNLTASNTSQVSLIGNHELASGSTHTIQSGSSLSVSNGYLDIGITQASGGTLVVTGSGSTLTATLLGVSGPVWGFDGSTANVTISDNAVANLNYDLVSIADGSVATTSGVLNVQSGAQFTAKQILLAIGSAGTGTITVTGANSALTATGSTNVSLAVGGEGASTSTGTINVQTGGTLTAGKQTEILKTGTMNIAGATFNANDDVTVDGGKLLRDAFGNFNLAEFRTLTASNGGQVGFTGDHTLDNYNTFTIQSGSSLTTTDFFDIGIGTGGTLAVTGPGSSFVTGPTASDWGDGDAATLVTIANQATATINAALNIGVTSETGTYAQVDVTSAAQMTTKSLAIGTGNDGAAVVTVTGTNSKITQTGSSLLTVGGTSFGVGTLNIQNAGTFLTGTGLTTISPNGEIDNAGGTFTAAAVLNNGDLDSASTTNTGAITGTGTTNVSGGTLTATGGIRQGTLSISGGGKAVVTQSSPAPQGDNAAVSRLSTLTIANNGAPLGTRTYTGTFDLKNNDLIVDYTAGNSASTLAALRDMIRAAFANGAWTGAGLTSSAAAADPTHLTALGVASNAVLQRTSFSGLSTSGTQVFVRYTYYGDADLNGATTLDDFTLFLNGYQTGGNTWVQGDFDYSGLVTLDDFTLFLAGYQQQGVPLAAIESLIHSTPMSAAERSAMLAAVAAVPEPTSLATAATLCGLGLLVRRRRTM
jgi:hypothetical protein